MENLKVMQYELEYDSIGRNSIILDRVYGIDVERWRIKWGDANVLSKVNKKGYYLFIMELSPSYRTKTHYKKCRWDTAEEALLFWNTHRHKIIATWADTQIFYNQSKNL